MAQMTSPTGTSAALAAPCLPPRRLLRDMVRAFANTVERVDPHTAGHQTQTARLAVIIARRLRFSSAETRLIHLGAMLHDIGKIALPPSLLLRPSKLTPTEFALVKEHPRLGWEMVSEVDIALPVATMIMQHHERLDGSGYPHGLHNGAIMPEALAIAAADKLHALISRRPYQPEMNPAAIERLLAEDRGTRLPAAMVDCAIDLFRSEHGGH